MSQQNPGAISVNGVGELGKGFSLFGFEPTDTAIKTLVGLNHLQLAIGGGFLKAKRNLCFIKGGRGLSADKPREMTLRKLKKRRPNIVVNDNRFFRRLMSPTVGTESGCQESKKCDKEFGHKGSLLIPCRAINVMNFSAICKGLFHMTKVRSSSIF